MMFNWFKKKKPCNHNTREVVLTVLRAHPDDCIFADNAFEEIMERLEGAESLPREEYITAVEEAIRSQEIYCPHEGIDRRLEFGLK